MPRIGRTQREHKKFLRELNKIEKKLEELENFFDIEIKTHPDGRPITPTIHLDSSNKPTIEINKNFEKEELVKIDLRDFPYLFELS